MKLSAIFAALLAVTPALAAPAVNERQIVVFPEMVTVVLNSQADGSFTDRTNYGTKTTPRLSVDPSDAKEQFRYAFQSNTDPKAFTWIANGKQLQCSIEVKAYAGRDVIELDLERDFARGLKTNLKGLSVETNCFTFDA